MNCGAHGRASEGRNLSSASHVWSGFGSLVCLSVSTPSYTPSLARFHALFIIFPQRSSLFFLSSVCPAFSSGLHESFPRTFQVRHAQSYKGERVSGRKRTIFNQCGLDPFDSLVCRKLSFFPSSLSPSPPPSLELLLSTVKVGLAADRRSSFAARLPLHHLLACWLKEQYGTCRRCAHNAVASSLFSCNVTTRSTDRPTFPSDEMEKRVNGMMSNDDR